MPFIVVRHRYRFDAGDGANSERIQMEWSEERVELLKSLWSQGRTASQIAEELGDVTRNAVIGKVHRLGLKSRPSPIRRERHLRRRPAPNRKRPLPPPPCQPAPPEQWDR